MITAAGRAVDVDAIVLATGFETSRYLSGIDVIGIGGRRLHERWGDDPSAYLGVAVSGFPNFFMLYGPNTNQGGNSIVYILEAGARLVASAVSRVARRGGYVDVRAEAEKRYNDAAFRGPGAHHLDPVRQLLPFAHRPHRHPVAVHRAGVRAPDLAAAAARLVAPHRARHRRGSAETEVDDPADQLAGGQVGVGVVDVVEPVAFGDHLVEE